MRNLRKLTAVVLAVALVLTSMAAAFAATESTTATVVNGDKAAVLKELKLYAGTDDKDPAAGLDAALKVQDALIWLATEFGYKAEADKLTDEDATKALAKFADAKDISEYAKKVVAYSAQEGIIAGEVDKAGKLYVRPAASVTAARFATFMLKGLGYSLTGSFTEAVAQLAEVEGSKIDAEAKGDLTRDAAVGFMYGILTAKTESGKTVAENILAADSSLQTVLSKNSLLPVNGTLAVDSVKAVANNKVAVTLKEAAAATAADFAIVKKGTTTAVAVKDITKESDKLYVVETDALTGGSQYTLTVNGASVNFTGLAADNTAPTIIKATSTDTNTFEVEFSDRMDFASVTDVANYTWDKSLKTVKAELNEDRNKVKLTTDAAKRNTAYTLTIQNVKNGDGKAMTKTTRTVVATEDKTVPRVTFAAPQNNRMIVVKFDDANGMNKAALETAANYSINDLAITSATAYDTIGNNDGKYDTVVLMTDTQTPNKSYTLTMENLTDNSVLANPLGKVSRPIRGANEDKTAPTIVPGSIRADNNNQVIIQFSDSNAMDAATLEDVSNYSITYGNNDVLEVISAKASDTKYPDGYKTRKVTLTTAAQEVGKGYRIQITGVADEFGNVIKTTNNKGSFAGSPVQTTPPNVKAVKYISTTKVRLVLSKELKKETVIDPTNYSINNNIGSPIKATLETDGSGIDNNAIDLTVPVLSANTNYTITINGVEDLYGNAMSNVKADVLATSGDLDTKAPSIYSVVAVNSQEIRINFDEKIDTDVVPTNLTVRPQDGGTVVAFTYSGVIDDGMTLVYKSSAKLESKSYIIATTTGGRFADAAGNKVVAYTDGTSPDPAIADRFVFGGNTAENDTPKVEYIQQINAKKIKVVFSEPVKMTAMTGFNKVEKGNTDIADDFQTEWNLTYSTAFKYNQKYPFSFSGAGVVDLTGTRVKDEESSNFWPSIDDNTAPSMSTVTAVNRFTVEIEYDEDISSAGAYKITCEYPNTSGDITKEVISNSVAKFEDNKVTLNLAKALEVNTNKVYYLQPTSPVRDLAGNPEVITDVRFDFVASSVDPVGTMVKGIAIVNATQFFVTANAAISDVKMYEKDSNILITASAIDLTKDSGKKAVVDLELPLLAGTTYVAHVTINGTTYTIETTGITPDNLLELKSEGTNTVSLTLNGETATDYYVDIYAVTGSSIGAKNHNATPTSGKFIFTINSTDTEFYVVVHRNSDDAVIWAQRVKL